MPNFKEFIKGFEEKPEAEQPMQEQPAQEQPKEKRQHLPLYSDKRRYIPATKTKYEKVGGKWQQMGEPETKNYTKEQAGNFFDKNGLPFEGGHRFEKKNLAHSEKYDTATVYNPDKTQKMVVDVDYEAGNKAFDKIRNKSLYDRERYKKMKEAKAQEAQQPKTKYEGGIAKDMQDAGFEPYGVDERNQILRVKDAQGADYEISQGEGYSYNVYKDGKKIYENVPNYMRFDTVVAGKPEAGFERYQAQEDISAPKPQPKQGSFEETFDENEPRMLYVVYDTPQGQVGDYIELDPDMSEDDIIDQLKENENVVGVYGGATNAGAIDPKWVRE